MNSIDVSIEQDSSVDTEDLADFLRLENSLRGLVGTPRDVKTGDMGGLLSIVEVAVDNGTVTAFTTAFFAWLTHRSHARRVVVKFRTKHGKHVSISCGSANDMNKVAGQLRQALDE